MRWLFLALFIGLILGMAQGYPLHASNGVVDCTIYGTFLDAWVSGNANSDSYVVFNVDLSLTRINASDRTPITAVYSLTDGNDRVFKMGNGYAKEFQPDRWLIGFVVPRETIARNLIVSFSKENVSGEQFPIYFPRLINSSNGNVSLLYYGVLRSGTNSNKKNIVLDIAVTNNGTNKLPLYAQNFTLKDQWGWKYNATAYDLTGNKGISKAVLEPNGTIRSGLTFSSLSPLSRPVELDYCYSNGSTLALDIDPESDLCPSKTLINCSECNSTEEQDAQANLAGSIKASKGLLDKPTGEVAGVSAHKERDVL
ncbi:MAG TPA: hypothetical protein VF300_02760 [Methanothrix sp.]